MGDPLEGDNPLGPPMSQSAARDADPPLARPALYARPVHEPAAVSVLSLPTVTRAQAWGGITVALACVLWTTFGLALLMRPPTDAAPAFLPREMIGEKWIAAGVTILTAIYLAARLRLGADALGLRRDGLARQAAWTTGGVLGVFAAHLSLAMLIGAILVHSEGGSAEIERRMRFMGAIHVVSPVEALALLSAVAIHEELLFRGVLLPFARRALGSWWAAVGATSLLFAALHFPQGALAVGQIFVISLVLSCVFVGSRSLPAVMIAHFLFDFGVFMAARVAPQLSDLIEHDAP
jgi:membrane protease YdiL (CAAX protease family)